MEGIGIEAQWRGFREIPIEASSAQKGSDRFSPSSDPAVLPWRNNLTALSQYHNLYFIAVHPHLHVHQPQFPNQLVLRDEVVIVLPCTQPLRASIIDPRFPHAVNQLVVGDLGSQEVVVLACDDGDVIVFSTRSIADYLASAEFKVLAVDSSAYHRIKPLFHWNVGNSAWGIAIHTAARMIAISTNDHVIKVFAPALAGSDKSDGDSDSSDGAPYKLSRKVEYDDDDYLGYTTSDIDRSQDVVLSLRGHLHNIPNISFSNTHGDRIGRYLASIDITGDVTIWNVWKQRVVIRHFVPDCNIHTSEFLPNPCGWGILCVESSSFKQTTGDLETFGCIPEKSGQKLSEIEIGGDISASRSLVRDSSLQHPAYNGQANNSIVEDDEDEEEDDDQDDQDEELDDNEAQLLLQQLRTLERRVQSPSRNRNVDDDRDEHRYVPMLQALQPRLRTLGRTVPSPSRNRDEYLHESRDEDRDEYEEMSGDNVEGEYSDITEEELQHWEMNDSNHSELHLRYGPDRMSGTGQPVRWWRQLFNTSEASYTRHHPIKYQPSERVEGGKRLPCSLLYTTRESVCFLENPLRSVDIILKDVLKQDIPYEISGLNQLRRLNMTLQVPELGMVAIACQSGRVALFTLTKTLCVQNGQKKVKHGMRLDWTLPFKSQEEKGERPNLPLIGIALGPLQGRFRTLEGAEDEEFYWRKAEPVRRYRLMLTYFDRTVLSYELGREIPGQGDPRVKEKIWVY